MVSCAVIIFMICNAYCIALGDDMELTMNVWKFFSFWVICDKLKACT